VSASITPLPGDIWSDRFSARRVRVLDMLPLRVRVKSVVKAGDEWQFKIGASGRSIDRVRFSKRFRLLRRPS
jgi:hypothetical protein